ncbi:1A family penicillin-binding protein [Desulfohalotomaculum tongense]|uniref:PBP1A family penicillin-binding protein n=1 Tax=Desulforadius tongensis TaxID=1216062 RepID=UPI00195BE602|nr:1A family penicillin-binding protein [Desulforadius tongensis]
MEQSRRLPVFLITIFCLLTLVGCSLQTGLPEPKVPVASRVLDSSGRLITTIGEYNRIPVKLEEISPYMRQAIVAVEDARFYKHPGVDPVGLLRAVYHNIRAGKLVEGGSTITQQLAKNLYLSHQRTLSRKVKEMYYAILLERYYTKDEILNKYLNTVYFGRGCYGVEAAAGKFFNKRAKDLTAAESAMLAGFVKAPSIYSDPGNIEAARKRQKTVLKRMYELNFIDEKTLKKAQNEPVNIVPVPPHAGEAGYFIAQLLKQLDEVLPGGKDILYTGGLEIETTLDLDMQKAAEEAVDMRLKNEDDELQAALVAINPANGYVVAMVGGKDYSQSQYNRALAARQPGSAFKPFVYAAALEHGFTAASTFFCGPVEYPQFDNKPYKPTDYGGGYHNRYFTLKEALKISDNVVAVQLNVQIGPRVVADLARRLGIKSQLKAYPSLALGTSEVTPMELANAYAVFAGGGILAEPIYFTRVKDSRGQVLVSRRSKLSRVMDEKHAYIITDMLKSVFEPGGTASNLNINRPAAGKTGTTDNYHDAWFVGYTPELVAAVYVGYDKDEKGQVRIVGTGGQKAGPIWELFMSKALSDKPQKEFTVPKGIVFKEVCTRDGLLASPASTGVIKAAFEEGTEPVVYCTGDVNWQKYPRLFDEQSNQIDFPAEIPWSNPILRNRNFTNKRYRDHRF